MRVFVATEDPDRGSALAAEVGAAGHEVLSAADGGRAPAGVELLLVQGPAERVPDLVAQSGVDTAAASVFWLADRDGDAVPEGVAHLAVEPLAAGELAVRLALVSRQRDQLPLEELLATAVRAAGDCIEITGTDEVLHYVNPAFTSVLGYSAAEALGGTAAALVRSEVQGDETLADVGRRLRAGEVWQGLLSARAKGGRAVYLDSTLAPVRDSEGRVTSFVGVKRDITARILAEQELREANDALSRARDAAIEASRAKSQFLANMSHELRTPLNAIIGYSEMLSEEALDLGEDVFIRDLAKIKSAGTHLLALINDVLDISKIEAGKMDLYLETFDVAHMVEALVETVRPLVVDRGNSLTVNLEDGLGLMRADLTKVRQSLLNLLSNANKFTDGGTIALDVQARELDGVPALCFSVRDSGIGMSEEQQENLFQPFVQADASTTRKYGGTGLGLAISMRFCEMMGGSIDVESALGEGSRFTLRLPRDARDPHERQSRSSLAPEGAEHTVLVIDDDPTVHDLLMRTLGARGFRVECVASGREGLELARQLAPDVIVLDVMMPGMDGWSVLTSLKGQPATSDIPVVMLSMVDQPEVGFALGAVDYLLKPVEPRRLARVIRGYCGQVPGRVLVVEDDPPTREVVRRILEGAGHVVVEAENGRQGLERVEVEPPDLILLDLMMPEMDGFELLERLRARREWAGIPVIVVTAKVLSEPERRRLDGAVQRIIRKGDYSRRQLLELVDQRVSQALARARVGEPQG